MCSGLTPTHWAFKNLIWVGAGTKMRTQYLPAHDMTTVLTGTVKFVCFTGGARCSSVVRVFAHGAMGRRINPSWVGPIELFLIPASAQRLV